MLGLPSGSKQLASSLRKLFDDGVLDLVQLGLSRNHLSMKLGGTQPHSHAKNAPPAWNMPIPSTRILG